METGYANPVAALDETRAELRVVARKLAACERALEGHGVYLGITDPVREEDRELLFEPARYHVWRRP